MLWRTFFTAGFAAGVVVGGLVVASALAFIASPDLVLADLFDDFAAEVLSDDFTVVELVVAGVVVLVALPSAASAGAVNSEAASRAAEICFNMVSSFCNDAAGMPFPFVMATPCTFRTEPTLKRGLR